MNSAATKQFWKCFDALPDDIQRLAVGAFEKWKADPGHPGLSFRPIQGFEGVYSVRVGINWRAIGRRRGDTIYWVWIGSHADYDGYLSRR